MESGNHQMFQPRDTEIQLKGADENKKRIGTPRNADLTPGVQKVENILRLWLTSGLILAWASMLLIAIAVSLDGQTISSYQPYALSSFKAHSMLAAISTLQNIL
jgi:hypothetical protein